MWPVKGPGWYCLTFGDSGPRVGLIDTLYTDRGGKSRVKVYVGETQETWEVDEGQALFIDTEWGEFYGDGDAVVVELDASADLWGPNWLGIYLGQAQPKLGVKLLDVWDWPPHFRYRVTRDGPVGFPPVTRDEVTIWINPFVPGPRYAEVALGTYQRPLSDLPRHVFHMTWPEFVAWLKRRERENRRREKALDEAYALPEEVANAIAEAGLAPAGMSQKARLAQWRAWKKLSPEEQAAFLLQGA